MAKFAMMQRQQQTVHPPLPSMMLNRGDRLHRSRRRRVDVVATATTTTYEQPIQRRRRSHNITLTVLILLGACIQTTLPFSIKCRGGGHPIATPIATTTFSTTTTLAIEEDNRFRWKSSLLKSTAASSSDSKQAAAAAAVIIDTTTTTSPPPTTAKQKISAVAATSTDDKISQLKEQQQQNKNTNTNRQTQRPNNKKGRPPHHNQRQRCSRAQNKKRHIRYLYSKARHLEKRGIWREASAILESILELDPTDAHSYLALARLESRRERGRMTMVGKLKNGSGGSSKEEKGEEEEGGNDNDGDGDATNQDGGVSINNEATTTTTSTSTTTTTKHYKNARHIFQIGTTHCPQSIHLYHAWAMHEQSLGNIQQARQLFDTALEIDHWNGYVCHAYGMLEMQFGEKNNEEEEEEGGEKKKDGGGDGSSSGTKRARQLWQRGLTYQPSAALVCSLGQLYTNSGHPNSARELYSTYIPQMTSERERIEVYLAASSLEETVYRDVERASQLLKEALAGGGSVHDSRAYVALARLGTSGGLVDDLVVKKRLKEICTKHVKKVGGAAGKKKNKNNPSMAFPVKDGRLFNAWAKLESKTNLKEARKILQRGMIMYPEDYTLLQAAGNIEERLGNVTAARDLYSASLHLEPSAPALIAYAMLELRSPEKGGDGTSQGTSTPNVTMVRKLFDEALLIDPKHGPIYNAYGNLERREGNAEKAKRLYEDGINANCTDAPSVYHGLAKLHLSLGEVEKARSVLQRGLALFERRDDNTYAPPRRNKNVAFLAHTLAMIELNVNNNAIRAKKTLQEGLWHCRNSPQLLLAMALCESRLGNENAARDMFERSLTADQRHAQAWQAFGVMEMQSGNFRTAKMLFECGLKNAPTHGALWQAYGTLESWKGNIGNARLLFAAGIEKCPQHVPLYQAWACLELRSGDSITAKRLIGEALTKDKRNGSGWLVAAKIEEKMNNHGLVGLILRRGIECAPGDTELYRALADHEISRGRIDSARELLEKGIEINPLYAPLYHSLAELEALVFNIDGLAKLNKRTAEIFSSDATAPPPSSEIRMQAWGKTIKQGRSIPSGVAALAEKIGVDSDTNMTMAGGSLDDVDPESLLNSMRGFGDESDGLMFQDVQMPDVDATNR